MDEQFRHLINERDFEDSAELEKDFLHETIDKLSSRDQESALEVAAKFDRFKKQAADEGEGFYSDFFDVLSQLIKRKYLDRDKDFGKSSLEDY